MSWKYNISESVLALNKNTKKKRLQIIYLKSSSTLKLTQYNSRRVNYDYTKRYKIISFFFNIYKSVWNNISLIAVILLTFVKYPFKIPTLHF